VAVLHPQNKKKAMESSRRTFLKRVLACAATYRVLTTAASAQSAMDQVIGVMFVIVVIGLLADKILFSP
jgi:hypothetical protein